MKFWSPIRVRQMTQFPICEAKPGVVSPVVGVSKLSQLQDLVSATELVLEPDDVSYLEELYRPIDNLLSLGSS